MQGPVVAILAAGERTLERAIASGARRGLDVVVFEDARRPGLGGHPLVAQLFELEWPDSFGLARERGCERLRSTSRWDVVCWLDADEWLTRVHPEAFAGVGDGEARCPRIEDDVASVVRVARITRLDAPVHYRGHEYVADEAGNGVPYRPIDVVIEHDGYDGRDRSLRNISMLRRQLREEAANPRWRPFLLRDGSGRLSVRDILDLNLDQQALGRHDELGGLTHDDHIRMAARATLGGLALMGETRRYDETTAGYAPDSEELEIELDFLRLLASVIAGRPDVAAFERAASHWEAGLDVHRSVPRSWFEAVMAAALDELGGRSDGDALRATVEPHTDELFAASRLRRRFGG